MYKEAKIFVLFSLVVMIIFGYGVKAYLYAPKQAVGGTVLASHDLSDNYKDRCDVCHNNEAEWHKQTFDKFNKSECMDCHGGAPKTPHATTGTYESCIKCHDGIIDGHNAKFTFPGTSYESCVRCHTTS